MVVSVVFRDTPFKHYDYLTDLPDVKNGDLVVVPTGSPSNREFAVVKVVAIKESSPKATAWVVQKVDVEGFNQKMEERELEAMLGA